MASKAPLLLAATALLLVPLPSGMAWGDPLDERRVSYHGDRDLSPLGNDTYAYAGGSAEELETVGPALYPRYCWRVNGDGHVEHGAQDCWRDDEAIEPQEGDMENAAAVGRIIVGAVIAGNTICVIEVVDGKPEYPCCSKEEEEEYMHLLCTRAIPGLLS